MNLVLHRHQCTQAKRAWKHFKSSSLQLRSWLAKAQAQNLHVRQAGDGRKNNRKRDKVVTDAGEDWGRKNLGCKSAGTMAYKLPFSRNAF